MPEEITALNEFGEAQAWESFYRCAPSDFAREYGVEVRRIGTMRIFIAAALPRAFFNRIVGAGIGSPLDEASLDEAVALFENAGCRNYMAQIVPAAAPPALPAWLETRGLTRIRGWAKTWRNDAPPAPLPDAPPVEAIGVESADAFAGVVLDAFRMPPEIAPFIRGPIGMPGWRHYLIREGQHAVSAAALYVEGEVGWLGLGSTLESHRGKGGQQALFARRIADGIALGCKWFVTETAEELPEKPNPSFRNMLRAGFRLAYIRANYAREENAR